MSDGQTVQEIFLRAVSETRCGKPEAATGTILSGCGVDTARTPADALQVYMRSAALIMVGAELCATALRRSAGDPNPDKALAEGTTIAIEVTSDGERLSFDDVTDDPCWATALRCVTAGLNYDLDLLSSVLKAHVHSHGLDSFLEIIADLVGFYLAFTDGDNVGDTHHYG